MSARAFGLVGGVVAVGWRLNPGFTTLERVEARVDLVAEFVRAAARRQMTAMAGYRE